MSERCDISTVSPPPPQVWCCPSVRCGYRLVRLGNAGAGCFELLVSSAIEERYAVVLRISQQLTARENNCQYPMKGTFHRSFIGFHRFFIVFSSFFIAYSRIFRNIRFHRTLPLSLQVLNLSMESQTMEALPTMWSSGTKPQKRESAELWRLSPIMK